MDINFIKEKIYHLDDNKKIQPGEFIPADVIEILKQGTVTDRSNCFVSPTSPDDMYSFEAELKCSMCNKTTVCKLSKTGILNYLRGAKKIYCDECALKIQEEQRRAQERRIAEQEKDEQTIIRRTNDYINNYLSPYATWSDIFTSYERTQLILNRNDIDYQKVSDYIKQMPYKDFLQTLYWKTISAYKKYISNYKCAICGSKNHIATHHKTYERHGEEHLSTVINNDLIVLCQDCHSKFHDKLPIPS